MLAHIRNCMAVVGLLIAFPCTGSAWNQGSGSETPCSHLIRAWVDPVFGVDGLGVGSSGTPIQFFAQVDDATNPFKTIQAAIDAVEHHLVTSFNAGNTQVEGIVYAMPGWYGPHPPNSSFGNGERLPIIMRDRVHVRGQGGRGCVIRGLGISGSFDPTVQIAVPMLPGVQPPPIAGEVLVDYSRSSKEHPRFPQVGNSITLPWRALDETMELLDGFTFQGGTCRSWFIGTCRSSSVIRTSVVASPIACLTCATTGISRSGKDRSLFLARTLGSRWPSGRLPAARRRAPSLGTLSRGW